MKLSDNEIAELNALIRKFVLPINKKEVTRHNSNYEWLRKNIRIKNSDRLTPRIIELLKLN
ncbi:hypothetical protein PQC16_gp204 [Rhizobium phage RHph_TM30]|uniref:Uncharacterized protein n=2 Tax=Cuauhnahuacvirus TaxID=3044696 RepID=A0A7S5R7X4_9CAUD|nr:hypothetical protein PQC16_gp204 [Rhizobium phage RHph_TM30]YP_010671353.1 hypothetical protein PQC17_gp204 [Rhizobium phage RHph_Y65]QIG71311.1 hypothetical protein EVB93_204 [Rhizobium phage RHph_TM30]QIG72037.1 hypothetical protein EVB95_203 [Rhizobium phage RHph_TM2_3B]QIG72762.1 hypothetical protein EVB97_204 [Rhizobium phage RHph_Y65]